MNNLCINCNPTCTYFPDMSIKEGEWEWDKEIPYIKRRKEKKEFRCGYDSHILDWNVQCPKELENLQLENLKEMVQNETRSNIKEYNTNITNSNK